LILAEVDTNTYVFLDRSVINIVGAPFEFEFRKESLEVDRRIIFRFEYGSISWLLIKGLFVAKLQRVCS